MFKVESILTPLLLSYVDKYVKNVSPKDSQVSLWGGEAVFNKLDLRLDVLEQELNLPFTFVNGHVHELRINVPWTKLGSEPIIVTVNTFECILKLKDGSETNESETGSDESSQKRKPQRLEVEDASPSFVQSLVTRILSNMNIICNNVILKYVEGDIVMSINVKSAQLHTANSNWEKAYIDTTQTDMIIRKIISLIDVTICLDQRDASGKIETYQDPLLYRSMIEGRAYIAYDSLTSRSPSVSRFDFRSDEMELSITDQQLPMLLRLAQLCMALYFGDLVLMPPKLMTDLEKNAEKLLAEGVDEEQTWGNWAWSLVPALNTIWEDDSDNNSTDHMAPNPVFHFATHLHKASITVKITETDSKSQKVVFRPIASINVEGLFLDAAVRHPDWASIQMGASAGQIVAVGDCLCNGSFMQHENQPVLASAGELGNNQMKYLDQSLFNESSPENQMQRRDYNCDWEEHFQTLTEAKMLETSPCFSMDYFYHLTLPDGELGIESEENINYADLEDSNLKERLMARVLVGPCQFNVNGDFVHRLEKKNRNFEGNFSTLLCEPVVIFECNRIELQQIVPMYPKRVVQVAISLPTVPNHFLYHSQSHLTGKVFGAEVSLANMRNGHFDDKLVIVPPLSCVVYLKELQFPEMWKNPFQPKTEFLLETSRCSIQLTWPQVLFISSILNSWYEPCVEKTKFVHTNLPEMAVSLSNEHSTVEFSLNNFHFKYSVNDAVHSAIAYAGNCCVVLQYWVNGVCHLVTLFHGPENKENIYKVNFFNENSAGELSQTISDECIKAVIQFPINMETCSAPTVFVLSIKGLSVYLDPALFDWFDYIPNIVLERASVIRAESPKKDEPTEGSAPSSTIPTESQSLLKISDDKMTILKRVVEFSTEFFSVFKRLLIEVQCETITIFLPINSTSSGLNVSHITQTMQKMFFTGIVSDMLVVNTPKVTLHSGTQKQNLSSSIEDIPIYTLEGLNLSQDLFPWTLTLANFSVYTLNSKKDAVYCINPLSLSATIALNTELLFDKLSKINLCLHADNESLFIQLSDRQVAIIANIAQTFLDAVSKFFSRASAILNLLALPGTKSVTNLSSDVGEKSVASVIDVLSAEIQENKLEIKKILTDLPKLTLWVQWTLPKLTVNLTSPDGCCLNLEFHELGLSLDVQEVYSKIKFTLKAFNWNHLQQDEFLNQLTPGPFKGIFFTCADKLSKNLNIPNPNTDLLDLSSDDLFEVDSSSKSKSSYNFLTVNLTRALSKNVQRRWTQLLRDHVDELEMKVVDSQSDLNQYVSEIDVKIRSFDCVLWFPVLTTGFRIFEPFFHLKFNFLNDPIQFASKMASEAVNESQAYQLKWFNNNNLPLLYLNISAIRIFIPKKLSLECTEKDHDMLIFQTKKISIASQVENPLSRIVLRSDILALAQQARIIHIPGSDVEDRQYQLDIEGISLSSGSWIGLIKRSPVSQAPSVSTQLQTMGENPALEWNNKYMKPSDVESELVCLPLLCNFNIRMIVAPAIVYKQLKEDILVAGHSFEVNLTTDLDIYLSFKQLALIYQISQENILNIMDVFKEPLKQIQRQRLQSGASNLSSEPDSGIETRIDSGTESELSTLHHTIPLKSASILPIGPPAKVIIEQQMLTNKCLNQTSNWNPVALVPFEMLFTARGFTFNAYTDKLKRSTTRMKNPKTKMDEAKKKKMHSASSKSTTGGKDGYEGSEEEFSEEERNPTEDVIIPIVYVAFSQPHAFLQCRHTQSKLDVSCFDFVMKGSNDNLFIPVTETKILPSLENYNVYWIETKPGDVNTRTGIPPALITISIKNFLQGLANIKVSLDRPWKLNISLLKYEQIMDYVDAAMDVTIKSTPASSLKAFQLQINKTKIISSEKGIVERLRYFATFIRFIHFKTVQVVTILETIPHKENAHVVLAWDAICGNIELKEERNSLVDEMSLGLCLDNFSTKFSYNKKLRPLLEPCCANINCKIVWDLWNKAAIWPRLCINLEIEAVIVSVGRESWLCLEKLGSQIESFLKSHTIKSIKQISLKKHDKSKSELELNEQTWHDDLRVGRFQYIQDSDDVGLQPAPNEIVFCKEQAGQSASMTWCYPEPRVITRAEIYPVPFRTTSSAATQCDNKEEVNCVFQYWDVLTRSYITCRQFQLSESHHCNLNLPHILPVDSKQQLFISQQWRVILDCYDPDNESEEHIVRRSLVSPLALAACMRVDSYFNPSLIPNVQLRLAIDISHINLTNHLLNAKDAPLTLSPFTFDGLMPLDQDFFVFNLKNFIVTAHSWNKWHKLEAKTTISSDILEYRNLTLRPLTEPCLLQAQLTYMPNQKPSVVDVAIRGDTLAIYLGQSAMHTLYFAYRIFFQLSSESTEQLFLTHYVICNDTQETIRFGQVDTDENIVLHSRKMHAYSWRSHRSKQLLHVCVEGMKWKWCEIFGIDKLGVDTRVMEQKGQKVTLIIKVKKFNKFQKQIIICGQLIFANRMDQILDVKLFPVFSHSEDVGIGGEKLMALDKQSSAASCLYEAGTRKGFRIRLPGENWSEEIHFPQKSLVTDNILVKVPFKKDRCLNLLCHFFTEQIGSSYQILVLFAPLYIIQTHLPCQVNLLLTTPKINETQSFQIDGWGREFQLHCPGSANVTHQLALRLGPEADTSQPSLPISTNMISQVTKLPYPKKISVEEMTTSWISNYSLLWPYDDKDFEKKLNKLPPGLVESILKCQKNLTPMQNSQKHLPNIELEVSMVQRWPACNTLLIHVKPWGLIINRSTLDLVIAIDGVDWNIENDDVFACSIMKEHIKLGIIYDDEMHYSDPLQITSDDWSLRRYWPNVINSVPLEGCVRCDIKIKKGNESMLCCLTLTTKIRHGIRLFQIQPAYNIVNQTDELLKVAAFSTPATEQKFDFHPECVLNGQLKLKSELDRNFLQPLLFWETFDPQVIYYATTDECIKYLSFCHSNSDNWSLPCRMHTNSNGRHCFSVPIFAETAQSNTGMPLATKPFVLTAHKVDEINYFVIFLDKTPQLLIHNQCPTSLYYGQSISYSSNGFQVAEETELVNCLPMVSAMSACHYTFPQVCKRFPDIYDADTMPKLHFANGSETTTDEEYEGDCLIWSRGVDVCFEGDLFLNIPNYGDVKVHLERIAHTMYVYIDPVSRVEVSAKEIRGRIESVEHVKVVISPPRTVIKKKRIPEAQNEKKIENPVVEVPPKAKSTSQAQQRNVFMYQSIYFKQWCLILLDDSSTSDKVTEFLRITGDNVLAVFRPRIDMYPNTKRIRSRIKDEAFLYTGQIQVDNQMFNGGNFDYPVVLVAQNDWNATFETDVPLELILQTMKNNSFFRFEYIYENDPTSRADCFESILFAMKPVAICVEDAFFFKFNSVVWKFLMNPAVDKKYRYLAPRRGKLPLHAMVMSRVYKRPLQCGALIIEPVDMKISIHSSMKLDISLVEVPLVFNRFERRHMMTSSGWVVGSVDLLGNPGGFARALGSGFADFVRMPYNGFFSGPWAFFSGMAYGTSALFRQFSSGSLFSLTNWASSVSRNMERISLDEDYHMQNEEYRRHRPDNLTEGLSQGLSGFGISLLAAIAGIIDQPIQSVQKAVDQRTPSAAVTGLVSGVGKGLVGIVAKPIAGAAELIAQAGHGILHGTGWSKIMVHRFEPNCDFVHNSCNGKLKYKWKMLSSLPDTNVICCIEATQFNQTGHYVPCVLLLTTQVSNVIKPYSPENDGTPVKLLFVVNIEEDTQQQAFGLSELDCHGPSADPTLVYLIPVQKHASTQVSKSSEKSQDRIADFVNKSTQYATTSVLGTSIDSESQSDSTSHISPYALDNFASCLKFYVSPPLRNIFIALFKTSKRSYLGKGFMF
uniref:Chorein N-terminal domain-containing protein n=1 Tax=Strigamia maritima TaxID=126957 RepID=T1IW73_STRMM